MGGHRVGRDCNGEPCGNEAISPIVETRRIDRCADSTGSRPAKPPARPARRGVRNEGWSSLRVPGTSEGAPTRTHSGGAFLFRPLDTLQILRLSCGIHEDERGSIADRHSDLR
jgi:hypothetical protein